MEARGLPRAAVACAPATRQAEVTSAGVDKEIPMSLASARKQVVIERFRHHASDTGSAEVQIALLTERINHLTEHFKTHKKDHHSRQGLLKLVNQRRKMLEYLRKNALDRYKKVIDRLSLRK